jgi:multidrug efflux system outer membrane protein
MDIGQNYRFEVENAAQYANIAWWNQFQDPALDQLIDAALQNNQDLKVASARVLEFYAKYKIVFSQLYPEITVAGGIYRSKQSEDINYFPPIPGVPRINNLYGLLFQFSYELDFWGKIRNSAEAAKSIYLSQVNAQRNVILTLVSSVAASYVLLKQYKNQLEISKLTYDSRVKSWDIARLRFDAGIVSDLDVQQAKSEALAAEVQIKNFEASIAKQEDLISVLIGQAPGPIIDGVTLNELAVPLEIPTGIPSDLLENRPDIIAAEQRILAANAEVGVARAAFLPSFALSGSEGQLSTAGQKIFNESANAFSLALIAFEPLFTGWRLTNQLNESEAVLLEALHGYQQTILTALKEVSDALIDHKKAKEKFAIQKERVASLQEYLKLANLRYFNGQNDYLTVLDAEKSLFTAELEETSTQGDLFLSLIALYKALGQGWDVEIGNCL